MGAPKRQLLSFSLQIPIWPEQQQQQKWVKLKIIIIITPRWMVVNGCWPEEEAEEHLMLLLHNIMLSVQHTPTDRPHSSSSSSQPATGHHHHVVAMPLQIQSRPSVSLCKSTSPRRRVVSYDPVLCRCLHTRHWAEATAPPPSTLVHSQ